MFKRLSAPRRTQSNRRRLFEKPVEVEKIVGKEVVIPKDLEDDEILVKLSPIQLYELKEYMNGENLVTLTNDFIEEANNYKSFWTGLKRYEGMFTFLEPGEDEEKKRKNAGLILINLFMKQIIDGDGEHLIEYIDNKQLYFMRDELA